MRTLYLRARDPVDSPYRQHEEAEVTRPRNYADFFSAPLYPEGFCTQLLYSPNARSLRAIMANLREIRRDSHMRLFATAPSLHIVLAEVMGWVRGRYVLLCWAATQRTAVHRWLFRQQIRFARRILVNDSTMHKMLIRENGVPPEKVIWVPFGVDVDYFKPVESPANSHLLVPGDAVRDEEFVMELSRSGLGPVMRGIKDAGIRDFYAALPAGGHVVDVRWLRPFSEIRANYQQAKAVIIPVLNDREPSGLTALLEGMACGRPCIINEGRTTVDYVEDNVTGFVLKGPRHTWLEQTRRTLADGAALERVGQAARARAVARHAMPLVQRHWLDAIQA